MPIIQGYGNGGYSVLTTAGTYTVNGSPPSTPGVGAAPGYLGAIYGVYVTTFGTSPVFSAYDVVPARGSVAVATNLLLNGTGTAVNQSFTPIGSPMGVRYQGALVIVVTGTANALNVVWD